jgi:DNA-binding phage protein
MTTEAETPTEVTPEIVAPVVVAAETPAVEAVAEAETPEAVEAKAEKQKGIEKRISELTRARREAERDRDHYKALASLKALDTPAEPKADDYDDPNDFQRDMIKHAIKTGVAETQSDEVARKARDADIAAQAAVDAVWSERISTYRQATPDYDAVIAASADLAIAPYVADALKDSDNGPALLYHMAKNPDIAERLNNMSPIRAAMEIGRIEAGLGGRPVKAPSNAPAPITPIAAARNVNVDLATATMADYIAARNKQGAGFRG